MSKPRVLFVFAHPDDELICGWPLLQDSAIDKGVLICSSDARNPQRRWCRHRKEALFALCQHLSIPCRCLDYDSDFFRTPHRPPRRRGGLRRLFPQPQPKFLLRDVCRDILENMSFFEHDAVFTHNPWGEYGHLDHVLLHNVVLGNTKKPVYMTDLAMPVDWLPMSDSLPAYQRMLAPHMHSQRTLDADFYERCATVYKKARVWTWSRPPLPTATVYCIEAAQQQHGSA